MKTNILSACNLALIYKGSHLQTNSALGNSFDTLVTYFLSKLGSGKLGKYNSCNEEKVSDVVFSLHVLNIVICYCLFIFFCYNWQERLRSFVRGNLVFDSTSYVYKVQNTRQKSVTISPLSLHACAIPIIQRTIYGLYWLHYLLYNASMKLCNAFTKMHHSLFGTVL